MVFDASIAIVKAERKLEGKYNRKGQSGQNPVVSSLGQWGGLTTIMNGFQVVLRQREVGLASKRGTIV